MELKFSALDQKMNLVSWPLIRLLSFRYCFEALVKFDIILEALWFNSLLASNPKGLKKLNFSLKGMRNVKIYWSQIYWNISQIYWNFQSCCIEYKIVTKRNWYLPRSNELIWMNINQKLRTWHSFSHNFTYKEAKLEFLYVMLTRPSYLRLTESFLPWEKIRFFQSPEIWT